MHLMQKFTCGKILSTIYLCVTMLLTKLQISGESGTEKKIHYHYYPMTE